MDMTDPPQAYYTNVPDVILYFVPEFRSAYQEHLDYMEGEVLNHVLIADFVRFLNKICSTEVSVFTDSTSTSSRILDCIEFLANSVDPLVTELVQVSFMENLHQVDDFYPLVRKNLKKESLELLKNAESFWLKDWLEDKEKIWKTDEQN